MASLHSKLFAFALLSPVRLVYEKIHPSVVIQRMILKIVERREDMHQALYRKWRPKSFDEVYGQDHITSILKYEIANRHHRLDGHESE